jgi:beta-galactosidase
MLQSYDSRWAIDFQRHNKDFDPVAEFDAFYRPLELLAQSVDIVSADAPIDGYTLLVAPSLHVLSQKQADRLADYVHKGGHLVLGPRSGMKDPYNALWPQRQPGPLTETLGAQVEQFYALDQPAALSGESGPGQATIWVETLTPLVPAIHTLMTYDAGQGWLDGKPAILTRQVGKGTITYIGAWLDPALMRKVAEHLLANADIKPLLPGLSPDIELCERSDGRKRVWILINHGNLAQTIHLPSPIKNLIVGGGSGDSIQLAAHDVSVVVMEGPPR